MKVPHLFFRKFAAFVLIMGCAVPLSADVVVDDFNTPGLGEYTFFKVLDQNAGTTNLSFSDASGQLASLSSGSTGAEQILLFRNDFTLGLGDELLIDGPVTGTGNDTGIAIGVTPTNLVGAGDTRALGDFLFISYRSPTQLNSVGFIGGAGVAQAQSFGVTVTSLFIKRMNDNSVELGFYNGLTRTITATRTPVSTAIFNNIGFYADLRADGAGYSGLDNLRIVSAVPEPGSMLVASFVAGTLVLRRRRK